ncbi:hypothetical protein B0H19DRAFT_1057719 [Mycena capillaripes]|nr:hypothetical protein B0H19DRAFT_1057719 [Mycena capillaripes]
MTVYAILTSFALAAVFLGLTVWSCLLVGQQQEVAVPRPSFLSNLFRIRSVPAPIPPQTFSTRWINHTWDVLHHESARFAGTSPHIIFLSIFVPAFLACARVRQQNQYEKARESEIRRRPVVDQVLAKVEKLRDQQVQPVDTIRASLKCSLCTRLYFRPYTLAPCGHTFDLDCLQRAFRTAPLTPIDRHFNHLDLPARQKLCPVCNAKVTRPPTFAWAVKTVVDAVSDDPDDDGGTIWGTSDPWKGIFKKAVAPSRA